MIITYTFADKSTSKVEVNDEIASVILESRRLEENAERRHRAHNYSLNAIEFEGEDYGRCDTYPSDDDTEERFQAVLEALTDTQRRRLLLRMEGLTYQQIADKEGTDYKTCYMSIKEAQKKFLKIF